MDRDFDHTAWPAGGEDGTPPSFDWHGLRARFLAAQAFRAELAPAAGAKPAGGSFDAAAAEALAGYEAGTPGINPIGLADRKGNPRDKETTPGQPRPTLEGNDD
jgi:hypothetical protein